MVILLLELTRVNPDRNIFSKKRGTSTSILYLLHRILILAGQLKRKALNGLKRRNGYNNLF